MNEIAKLYFQWPDGTDDTIVLETGSIIEMNKAVDDALLERKGTFTGLECLQQCDA